ncbi:MAG: capsule biosynthesis protein [Alphaproteobacteria bacterium]|nr:capsule biosynthesis protein [Alphaproteobacteria bacterium]
MAEFLPFRRARAVASPIGADVVVGPRSPGALRRLLASLNIWFWAIVGVPTLIAGVYYFAIASDMYLTEAKFIVRGPAKAPVSGMAALLEAGGAAGNGDEATVQEFIRSRDAVRKLEQADDLRAVFNRPEGDIISRFPGAFYWRDDFEALYKTYSRFVSVETDSSTGVSTLQVKAYRPEDAQMVAQSLLSFSEQLINQLNERARSDALSTFQREVSDTQQHLAKIQTELTAYRMKENMLDPKSASAGPLELLAQLNTQQANAKAQLSELSKNSPNSPQIPLIKTRIASLDKLIEDERAKITGDNNSVAAALTEYERLNLDRELAQKTLASAFASLESARLEAQRQQLYLETIAQPNLADYPLYPKRVISFAMVAASCLLAYGIAWLLVASVREHTTA